MNDDIKQFCDNLFSQPDPDEVNASIEAGETDFTVDNVRFVRNDAIDQIQRDELALDEYVLGCFNADFLAGVLNIDAYVIKTIQDAGAFGAIGKLVIGLGKLAELQTEYASLDGYGHHFNGYDFGEEELRTPSGMYHVFDQH